ncbi:putative transmembrane efflux protein [Actinacidiphila reveromycinica]|uniref:Putative transmembrane efflux protein n=1 Tax=Actinacidiphila reveromycinica TaxID=659352 RepID=A0A7U3VSE2_9ACTN|nr:MFS transporter [Streptomyces sp. SN-593]BBB01645.1 putative transmembrane efflux protein [Streptomyces sp. SN-593]
MPLPSGLCALRAQDFRRFFIGYATSLLGSSTASVALAFAILTTGGGGTELGFVLTARIVPLVLVLLAGGVVADRLGSRQVMLTADTVRCLTQGALALLLLGAKPPLWALVALVALWGAAEALFTPALNALIPRLAPDAALSDANALLGMAASATSIAGPALAGVLTAVSGASSVLALDAASYGVSVVALLLLPRTVRSAAPASSFAADLRSGWDAFRSRTWLWVTTAHVGLMNLFVWAPFLVLGPVVAQRRLGGSAAWGLVMAGYGAGAVAGGLALLGRRPHRPLLVGTAASLGWSLPPATLAAGLPLAWVCAAAFAGGVGSALCTTLYTAGVQREVPPDVLARVSAYGSFGAFVLGPVGLAAAGPVSVLAGTSRVLGFGLVWQVSAVASVLTLPAIRAARPRRAVGPQPGDRGPAEPAGGGGAVSRRTRGRRRRRLHPRRRTPA